MKRMRIQCPFCFERFRVEIAYEDGETQDLIHDCEVCCHPVEIHAVWVPERERFRAEVQKSSGFD